MRRGALFAAGAVAVAIAIALVTCAERDEAPPATDGSASSLMAARTGGDEPAPRRRRDDAPPESSNPAQRTDALYAGTVVAAETGDAIAGARVALVAVDPRADRSTLASFDLTELASAVTGADGAFEIRAPAHDRASLRAVAPGRAPRFEGTRPGLTQVLRLTATVRREVTVLAGEDRTPLAGARILVGPRGAVAEVAGTAGPDGRVAFESSRDAQAFATAQGRMTMEVPAEAREVLLWQGGGAVAGVVTADGRGVDGARVVAKAANFAGPFPVQVSVTGGDGGFSFDGFPVAGEVALEVAASGFLSRKLTADVGDHGVVVSMSRRGVVRGVVLAPDGSPAAGARVEAQCDPPQVMRPTATDAEGRFEVEAPADGDVEIRAQQGCIEQEAYGLSIPASAGRATVSAAERDSGRNVVVRLVAPAVSFARLEAIDPEGRRLRVESTAAPRRLTEATDENGRLSASFALPAGTKVVTRIHTQAEDGVANPPFPIEFSTSADPGVPFTIVRSSRFPLVRLAVASAEGVVPPRSAGGMAVLWELTPTGPACLGSSMGGGAVGARWRIDPAKRYRIKVLVDGLGVVVREFGAGDVAEGPLDLRLDPPSRIRGRVIDAEGRPATGVIVWAGHGGSQADPQGAFDVTIADAGETRISVMRGLATVWSEARRLVPGEVIDLGTIVATPPRSVEVRGVVRDASSRPVGAAQVWHRPPDQSLTAASVRTGPDGAFVLALPESSRGALLATKRGHGAAWAAVDDGAATVVIQLVRPGRIRFAEVDDASTYGVRAPDGVTWWPSRQTVRDAFGVETVELTDLPPGRLVVFAETARGRIEREAEVVEGEAVVVGFE